MKTATSLRSVRSISLAGLLFPLARASAESETFDVNDLSFLWPVPAVQGDLARLISLADDSADGQLMSDELFAALMKKARTVSVGDSKIGFAAGVAQDKSVWRVAGIRVNPVSISSHRDVIKSVGEVPSLRLVVQPVTVGGDGTVKPHDTAAHVVFDYLKGGTGKEGDPFVPDTVAFRALVNDLLQLKADLEGAGVVTRGTPLAVHPGFALPDVDLAGRLRSLLKTHVSNARLNVVSFMGIPEPAPEPWGFFSVLVDRRSKPGGLVLVDRAVGGHFATQTFSQIMDFRKGASVVPEPVIDPAKSRQGFGIGTSPLFAKKLDLESRLLPGAPERHPLFSAKLKDVPDLIANPALPFFNTGTIDCASCHSETTRRLLVPDLNRPSRFAFQRPEGISGVSDVVLPRDDWNVRDFGWGFNFRTNRGFHPTVSQRAANEAAESTDYINRNYLSRDQ